MRTVWRPHCGQWSFYVKWKKTFWLFYDWTVPGCKKLIWILTDLNFNCFKRKIRGFSRDFRQAIQTVSGWNFRKIGKQFKFEFSQFGKSFSPETENYSRVKPLFGLKYLNIVPYCAVDTIVCFDRTNKSSVAIALLFFTVDWFYLKMHAWNIAHIPFIPCTESGLNLSRPE